MAVLALALAWLFHASFAPGMVHFSSDGPLGVMKSQALAIPYALTGFWMDLSWVGMNGGTASSSVSYLLIWLLGPVGFAKFYPPITLLLLGAAAWMFFRTLRLSPGLCGVAAIGAALNMNFVSNACWGVGTRGLTLAAAFLALAALNTRHRGNRWLNAALAGLAVGLGVIEGADNGAIFSLFIAAYVLFQAWVEEDSFARRLVSSLRLGLVAVCAALIAAQVLAGLTGVAARTARGASAKPAATAEERAEEEEGRWRFATQWSLPPIEMLRVIIPGIYGYRTDAEGGAVYWGRVGQDLRYPDGPQRRASRSSGAGEYAGVLVVLIGLWALFHAWRGGAAVKSIFEERERKYIFFWAAMFVPAMLFSWGYHVPFYKLVYWLPYFSTIRNPMKFMHPGHMCLMILFAYGLLGLSRRYLESTLATAGSFSERLTNWRAKALPVERWWFRGAIALAVVGVLAFLVYAAGRGGLTRFLQENRFPEAGAIASHSVAEVGKFAVVLAVSVALVCLIQIGVFAGARRKWAVLLLGALLALDLARANAPWVKYYDYREQYATNPVINTMAKEPWLHRTAVFPAGMIQQEQAAQLIGAANQIWRGPWLQWHCQYYNIQSIDMAQDPRPPSEKTNYLAHVSRNSVMRLWELTNTRYLFGIAGLADVLNQQFDPARRSFRSMMLFTFPRIQYGEVTVQTNDSGPWALIEFGGALPRAKLFTNWRVSTNDQATLDTLGDPAFDPHTVVLVNEPVDPPAAASTNAAPGTVEFVSYAPKHIVLKAAATAPSMLLLNDQFDRNWSVTVNGQPTPMLRANYLMRAVAVPGGASDVVFHFQPSLTPMKVTLAMTVLGLLGCALLAIVKPRAPAEKRSQI